MKTNGRRRAALVLAIILLISALAGCGDFRKQALEARDQFDDMLQRLEVAEAAAARNASQILELQSRIEKMETELSAWESSADGSNTGN